MKNMVCVKMFFFIVVLVVGSAVQGFAAPLIYHDRAAFSAAAGALLVQDFSSYAHEQSISGQILPGVEVKSNMDSIVAWNPPYNPGNTKLFAFGGTARESGNAYYEIAVMPGFGYQALGFDIVDWETGGDSTGTGVGMISMLFGGNIFNQAIFQVTRDAPVFFGVITDAPIQYVRWYEDHEYSRSNEESGMDNIMVGRSGAVHAAPEPSSLLLLGMGLAGLTGICRRRAGQ